MPAHLRVSLADRPGALAALTRALAAAGANVLSVVVVQRESGRAVDDLLLDWPFERPWDAVVRAVEACNGARLHGLRHVADVAGVRDTDVVLQTIGQPHRAAETLVDALPALLLADWSALVDRHWPREAVYATADAPSPLPVTPATLPRPRALVVDDDPVAAVPLASPELRILVGRAGGPGFTRTELDRCAGLVAVVADVVALAYSDAAEAQPTRVTAGLAKAATAFAASNEPIPIATT
jgi:ACT domain